MKRHVQIRREGPLASIVLDDSGTLNSMSLQMTHELRLAFAALAEEEAIRVVLLEGAGGNFSAGGNLGDAAACALEGPGGAARFMTGFNALLRAAYYFPKPLIGVVRGSAAGGAVGLLLCADIILVARTSCISLAFINIGLAPDCGTSLLLARRIGIGRAKELALTGRRIDGEEASRMGLADGIHAEDELGPQATRLAQSIAVKPPLAVMQSKQLVQRAQSLSFDEALDMEAAAQALLMQTADFREGVAAFLEKRRAAFTGS